MSLTPSAERRKKILNMVEVCVCRDRQNSYSDAEDNFPNIAKLASVALQRKLKADLDAVDVALFSACIKLGRLAHDPRHIDSLVDLAGYAVCGGGIVMSEGIGDD
jgi:hypothetical protein